MDLGDLAAETSTIYPTQRTATAPLNRPDAVATVSGKNATSAVTNSTKRPR